MTGRWAFIGDCSPSSCLLQGLFSPLVAAVPPDPRHVILPQMQRAAAPRQPLRGRRPHGNGRVLHRPRRGTRSDMLQGQHWQHEACKGAVVQEGGKARLPFLVAAHLPCHAIWS